METERQLLKLTRNKTKAILDKGNLDKIIRHKEALETIVKDVEKLKLQGEKAKIKDGVSIEDVQTWGANIEGDIDKADGDILRLNQYIQDAGAKSENEKREKEKIRLQEQREEELYFEKCKLEQQAILGSTIDKAEIMEQPKVSSVKLPKLIISKYDGSYERWLSFWNKFEAEIDSTTLHAITKFSYLKELLEPKVCNEIDGLPFTTEGYARAKNILKTNHGNTSEIVRAYITNIQELPTITGRKINMIHEFIKTLNYNVQSLETLGKLSQCLSMVRGILEKLPGIKAELVTNQVGWQDWGFTELLGALENCKAIHPLESSSASKTPNNRSFFSKESSGPKGCVYCDDEHHRSHECKKVVTPVERRQKLQAKKLCFNCTGARHHAAQCRSRVTCFHCKKKHHSSICETIEKPPHNQPPRQNALTATHEENKVCHPIVIVKANNVTCRALLDTGATTSYASAYLLSLMKLSPSSSFTRCIQTITGTITKHVEVYNLSVSDTQGNFLIPVGAAKVDRRDLLSVGNPNYPDLISRYQHLQGVCMEDTDTKPSLLVHLILGAAEYSKIKTSEPQRTGSVGDPVAEYTRFGWTVMSPGIETNLDNMFLAQTARSDYEELCRMDVLGLEDTPVGDQKVVHEEFLEQLRRDPEQGWYESGLPWKGDHPPLPSNEANSLKRLGSLVQQLKKTERLDEYDAIIQDQLKEGIVEHATEPPSEPVFYLPHHPVIRESAESTKIRIVYDASSKTGSQPSLNDCLNNGPPLQNQLFKVLVRGRFHPVALNGDIRKAFLQVRIRPDHRDAMRFHWLEDKDPQRICTLRFTRALFGMGPSPFLLGGVLQCHLNASKEKHPKHAAEIEKELYVDDLVTGGTSVHEVREKKEISVEIFKEASFDLHKWQSNIKELEQDEESNELVCAKARLAKQGLTIPRKELVSAHMAVNLLDNVCDALDGFPVSSLVGWLDSSVALHWIRGRGQYKLFVANRVNKILQHKDVRWRHVPSKENPADIASRGGLIDEGNQLWWNGPNWLSNPEEWPPDLKTTASVESNEELKLTKQVFALATEEDNDFVKLLSKFAYWKTLRVIAWLLRFVGNTRCLPDRRVTGPLTTREIEKAEKLLTLNGQQQIDETFPQDQLRLNLQPNEDGVLECRGRVQGFYPIYIPGSSLWARKFVEHAHKSTLHGGVGLTMVKV